MRLLYKEHNANPKGRKTSDCVIRALSTATGKAYADIYRELFEISLETGYMLNEKRVEDKLLARYGFVKMKQPKHNDGTKYRIGGLPLLTNARVVVVRCAHHLTCVKDGVLIDTWDCRNKTINNYYVKQ